jgi:ABC-type multidrug transport system ATPase subunit
MTTAVPVLDDEVIRTDALTKRRPGDVLAVDGLDLSVRRSEIFGLLGPNGAGRSKFMHRPVIVFLDEPTAELDPQSRISMWEILGESHGDAQTILLTTRSMEEAEVIVTDLHLCSSPSPWYPASSPCTTSADASSNSATGGWYIR